MGKTDIKIDELRIIVEQLIGNFMTYSKATELITTITRERVGETTKREPSELLPCVSNQRELLISFCNYYAEVCKVEFNAKEFLIKSFLERNL